MQCFLQDYFLTQNKNSANLQAAKYEQRVGLMGVEVWIQIYLLQMKRNPYLDSEEFEDGINWNPSSHFEEQELCLANHCMLSSEIEGEKKRPSHKNKYINKITLIKPQETANTKKRHFNPSDSGLQPEQFKKLKNREAAKESRQRKKLYINLIEEQTKKLEKEIQLTNRQIESCKIEIQKSAFNNNQSIGALDTKVVHVFKKIERLLATEDGEEKNNQLNLAIDSIIYRYGATGKERKNNINERYRQILAITPPIVHRYFLWSAKEKAHLFATAQQETTQQWFSEMKRILMPNIVNNPEFLQNKRIKIAENQQQYSSFVFHLRHTQDQIEKFLNILDNQFLEVRDILTPVQSAKLILFIQKYKYREQLRFIDNQEGLSLQKQPSHPPNKPLKVEELI